jgi:hypothetical protein
LALSQFTEWAGVATGRLGGGRGLAVESSAGQAGGSCGAVLCCWPPRHAGWWSPCSAGAVAAKSRPRMRVGPPPRCPRRLRRPPRRTSTAPSDRQRSQPLGEVHRGRRADGGRGGGRRGIPRTPSAGSSPTWRRRRAPASTTARTSERATRRRSTRSRGPRGRPRRGAAGRSRPGALRPRRAVRGRIHRGRVRRRPSAPDRRPRARRHVRAVP